jgi:death on curing protein
LVENGYESAGKHREIARFFHNFSPETLSRKRYNHGASFDGSALHDRIISEHGGPDGIRDRNGVESALARPKKLAAYENPDAAALAAAYAYGLARNHGFVDGNKRIACVAARVFLADNGFRLVFDPLEAVRTIETLAAGRMTEAELAEWFSARIEA